MSNINKINIDGTDYDLYGLGGDVLPIGSEIDILSTTSVPVGWQEVDNTFDTYSSSEQIIGRWIDGRPLYRKVITYTGDFRNCAYVNVGSVPMSDIEDVTKIYWTFTIATKWYIGGQLFENTAYKGMVVKINNSGDVIAININNDLYGSKFIGVLEYTKTADSANTPITKRIKKVTQSVPPALLEEYSETEEVVGTWITGKPIYRKVIDYYPTSTIGSSSGITDIDIPHNISNLGQITNVRIISDANNIFPHIGTTNGSNLNKGSAIISSSSTNIQFRIAADTWGSKHFYIIVEYTKTTD